jgi:hypothetical protein
MQERPKFVELRDKARKHEVIKDFKRAVRMFERQLDSGTAIGNNKIKLYQAYDDAVGVLAQGEVHYLKDDDSAEESLEAVVKFTYQRVEILLNGIGSFEESEPKKAYSYYKRASLIVNTLEARLDPVIVKELKIGLAEYIIPRHLDLLEGNFNQEKLDHVVSEITHYRKKGVEVRDYVVRLTNIMRSNN